MLGVVESCDAALCFRRAPQAASCFRRASLLCSHLTARVDSAVGAHAAKTVPHSLVRGGNGDVGSVEG